MLNERNEKTKKIIHLMVTSLCNRDCPHCCNKQYDLNDIPYVTDKELKEAEVLCLTGGEPFAFTDPNAIAKYYKEKYPNIKAVYAYSNASELYSYVIKNSVLWNNEKEMFKYLDGFSVSIKNLTDKADFIDMMLFDHTIFTGKSNRLYYFSIALLPGNYSAGDFVPTKRDWQEEFVPADDSIFRRV